MYCLVRSQQHIYVCILCLYMRATDIYIYIYMSVALIYIASLSHHELHMQILLRKSLPKDNEGRRDLSRKVLQIEKQGWKKNRMTMKWMYVRMGSFTDSTVKEPIREESGGEYEGRTWWKRDTRDGWQEKWKGKQGFKRNQEERITDKKKNMLIKKLAL